MNKIENEECNQFPRPLSNIPLNKHIEENKNHLKKLLSFIPLIGIIIVVYYSIIGDMKEIGFNNKLIFYGSAVFQSICMVSLGLLYGKV